MDAMLTMSIVPYRESLLDVFLERAALMVCGSGVSAQCEVLGSECLSVEGFDAYMYLRVVD